MARQIESITRLPSGSIYERRFVRTDSFTRNVASPPAALHSVVLKKGVDNLQIIFIAVPTPPQSDRSVDLSFHRKSAREIEAGRSHGSPITGRVNRR